MTSGSPTTRSAWLVRDVCQAIIDIYEDEVVSCPSTEASWHGIANRFGERKQFQHTLRALDSKHIAIRCSKNCGSLYNNYKGFHSIFLLALVDDDYKFIWADIGANGSAFDMQVFVDSELRDAIDDGMIDFP